MAAELASGLEATDAELLEQAEAVVRSWCGWHIAPERTETVLLDTTASPYLMLPTLRLVAVTAVTLDGDTVDLSTVEWSESGYLRRHWGTTPVSPRTWNAGPRRVAVTFTHGFEVPPPGVTGVVQALAKRAKANTAGLVSVTRGPFSETYSTDLLPTEVTALAAYRLPSRP